MNTYAPQLEEPLTPERLFSPAGTVERSNYRRTWIGNNYRMNCGKHKGKLLSEVNDAKYVQWCLNEFEGKLTPELERALKDQFNQQFS